jgi:hypothetical protein
MWIHDHFKILDVLERVLKFVGMNQYRFVAGVNRDFQTVNVTLFPNHQQQDLLQYASTLKPCQAMFIGNVSNSSNSNSNNSHVIIHNSCCGCGCRRPRHCVHPPLDMDV